MAEFVVFHGALPLAKSMHNNLLELGLTPS
ncbi:hypothetical protein COLO4_36104 [Corchorus olitorius]|uniref:Uncharacterized protein n=1 Tax=Corchorus olitorius TaxID=93759 RepID=A0A1R3GB16_9ROSI|nr:hypothetical protein COLO4_36104 [Corchorus olitorius]